MPWVDLSAEVRGIFASLNADAEHEHDWRIVALATRRRAARRAHYEMHKRAILRARTLKRTRDDALIAALRAQHRVAWKYDYRG